ncbi:MAG: hypothetical protein ACXAD7_25990 [Candidatus Kariarchaeaceae archaeon]
MSSVDEERISVGEGLEVQLNDDDFNETIYDIQLPGGDNATIEFIITNEETSDTSIGYRFFGWKLHLLSADKTTMGAEDYLFQGTLKPGETSTDTYKVPGLCCDCIKSTALFFNKSSSGFVKFKLEYNVLDDGDTCDHPLSLDIHDFLSCIMMITLLMKFVTKRNRTLFN